MPTDIPAPVGVGRRAPGVAERRRPRFSGPLPFLRRRRIPEDPQQKVNRHKIGILGSGHGEGFVLSSLPSDRRSVSRAFWATGPLSETSVFRNHLDILIYFPDFYNAAPPLP
jgi:hypothetical protein